MPEEENTQPNRVQINADVIAEFRRKTAEYDSFYDRIASSLGYLALEGGSRTELQFAGELSDEAAQQCRKLTSIRLAAKHASEAVVVTSEVEGEAINENPSRGIRPKLDPERIARFNSMERPVVDMVQKHSEFSALQLRASSDLLRRMPAADFKVIAEALPGIVRRIAQSYRHQGVVIDFDSEGTGKNTVILTSFPQDIIEPPHEELPLTDQPANAETSYAEVSIEDAPDAVAITQDDIWLTQAITAQRIFDILVSVLDESRRMLIVDRKLETALRPAFPNITNIDTRAFREAFTKQGLLTIKKQNARDVLYVATPEDKPWLEPPEDRSVKSLKQETLSRTTGPYVWSSTTTIVAHTVLTQLDQRLDHPSQGLSYDALYSGATDLPENIDKETFNRCVRKLERTGLVIVDKKANLTSRSPNAKTRHGTLIKFAAPGIKRLWKNESARAKIETHFMELENTGVVRRIDLSL